jgi:hypothetical protein
MSVEQWWNDTDRGKLKEVLGEIFVSVLVVPLQITNVLSWDVRRFSAVTGRRLTV